MADVDESSIVIAFGPFRVYPRLRVLLREGQAVPLGSRSFDLLMALLETPGVTVAKNELLRRAWPGRVVEENSLQAQISALRRALGAERQLILTVAGRGYQFTGLASVVKGTEPPLAKAVVSNLPARTSELLGRESAIADLLQLLRTQRIVTLTGPGGIGKTQLAFEVARRLAGEFPGGVHVAELASAADAHHAAWAVAAQLGLPSAGEEIAAEAIAAVVGNQAVLLVLDCCEHVIQAAALIAEAVVRAGALLRVLATSREPLRVEAEYIYRLAPLSLPVEEDGVLIDGQSSGALQLFLARAQALDPQFKCDQVGLLLAAAICRRLDGIPLAIEMAAARAATLGLAWVASRINDRFSLLVGAQRTALARHQTLRATIDWSYELLGDIERSTLQALAIFEGRFALDWATAVAASASVDADDVVDALTSLVDKSLVMPEIIGVAARYRLLESTRAYALEKLQASGQSETVRNRHSELCAKRLKQAHEQQRSLSTAEWITAYRSWIDDVRVALDWDFSAGNPARGAELLASAGVLFFDLRLFDECRRRTEQAMSALQQSTHGGRSQMRSALLSLTLLHSMASMQARGPSACQELWARALDMAVELDDSPQHLRALWGLWSQRLCNATPSEAVVNAQQFAEVASQSGSAGDVLMGRRLLGTALHYAGHHSTADLHLRYVVSHYIDPVHRSGALGWGIDQQALALASLARTCWLRGLAHEAKTLCTQVTQRVQAGTYDLFASCFVLTEVCIPVDIWAANWPQAERSIRELQALAKRLGVGGWDSCARCWAAALLVLRADVPEPADVTALTEAMHDAKTWGYLSHLTHWQCLLAQGVARGGSPSSALQAIDESLRQSAIDGDHWCRPELLRVKAGLVGQSESEAVVLLTESIALAAQQQAFAWEVRSTVSLAQLRHGYGELASAQGLLSALCCRVEDGMNTPDVLSAQALLLRWQQAASACGDVKPSH